ncbi:MAG: hypothetical protein B9S38_14525 [Verrucomicrobiia bacterium Tous-C4TDCM]|nr:MAG: hypothetical protein B9S38_14525 [Verrucomicrobiae bacterium Tous-C4TDCM]
MGRPRGRRWASLRRHRICEIHFRRRRRRSHQFRLREPVPGGTGNVATDLAATATGGGARRGALNAIQLVQVVPEPSTALLSALGILGLIVRRRR